MSSGWNGRKSKEFQENGRGVVDVQRLLWLEYEVEGLVEEGVRQRLEQHMLAPSDVQRTPEASKL